VSSLSAPIHVSRTVRDVPLERKILVAKILSNKARCLSCQDVIESTSVHHFVSCRCGAICVDGGLAYLRRSASDPNLLEELSDIHYELCVCGHDVDNHTLATPGVVPSLPPSRTSCWDCECALFYAAGFQL